MIKHIFKFLLFAALSLFLIVSHGVASLLQESANPSIFFYAEGKPTRFIIVEKKNQRLMLFEQVDSMKFIREFISATGENPGTKKISGDERTPEGVYYITELHKDNKISVFGTRAFHLDYPNTFDTRAGRLGDGIYIHGTNRELTPNSTNGCITLNNNDLELLAPYLTINDIPIIILDTFTESFFHEKTVVQKNDPYFNEILRALSINPKNFRIDNITSLYFVRQGAQAVAAIDYNVFEENSMRYQVHKRAYLMPDPVNSWLTLVTFQNRDTIPTIIAKNLKKIH